MRDEQRETDIGPIGEPTKRSATAIHPVNATVERVARKEPPPAPRYIIRYYAHEEWRNLAAMTESQRTAMQWAGAVDSEGVEIIDTRPDPLPSPASAEIDQLLVDLRAKIKAINALELKREDDALRALDALSERLGRVTR